MESLDNVRSVSPPSRTFIRPCSGFNRIEERASGRKRRRRVLNAPPLSSFIHPNTLSRSRALALCRGDSLRRETGTRRWRRDDRLKWRAELLAVFNAVARMHRERN